MEKDSFIFKAGRWISALENSKFSYYTSSRDLKRVNRDIIEKCTS